MSDLTQLATGILPASGYKAGVVYGIVPENPETIGLLKNAFDFTSARNGVANRTNENGVLEEMANDVCRVEYPTCPSLLLEPASTNLVLQNFNLSVYATVLASWTTGQSFPSVDLPLSACALTEDTSNNFHRASSATIIGIPTGDYVLSVYAKFNGRSWLRLRNSTLGVVDARAWFDIENGELGTLEYGNDYGMIDVGDGWYRCWISTTNTLVGNFNLQLYLSDRNGGESYQGDGVSGIIFNGASIEPGTALTSVIKTEATTVTRPQDTLAQAVANSDMYNDAEGVIMIDGLFSQGGYITLLAGTDTLNSVTIASVGGFLSGIVQATTEQANLTTTIDATVRHKVALRYQANDFSLWVDGVKEVEDLAGLTPTGLDNIKFNNGAGASVAFGLFAPVYTSPIYLTDEEMAQLTT